MRVKTRAKGIDAEKYVLVEDEEALENLELVLVVHSPTDLVVQLGVCERHLRTQPLVRESRPDRGMICKGTSRQHRNQVAHMS